jgi:alkanesulfonate monooxygenase SsuD/methylene tetrahydromethanopterin reductase-like flavin-dependent oxidoreductase (luciferase family)
MSTHPASMADTRPLKVGLFLPVGETMLDGDTAGWADLLAMARLAEEVGFDSLWVADHLLMRFPNTTGGGWECWSLLAALAATTRRVTLGPLVSCMSYRNPALLAKMADTVDEISGGRLILGLGAGWHEPEYRAFGYPYDHRVSRFEEGAAIVHGLLRDGHVDFVGRYHQARECELRPRGPRAGQIPLMIGTTGARMLRLAARYADIWNTDRGLPTGLVEQQAALDAACMEEGRDPTTLPRTAMVRLDLPGMERQPFGMPPARVSGTPEELAVLFRGYAAQGITHLQVWLGPNSPAGVERFARVLELLKLG